MIKCKALECDDIDVLALSVEQFINALEGKDESLIDVRYSSYTWIADEARYCSYSALIIYEIEG